jgi:ribosome-associated heat shock protein Hsp15
MNVRIDKWLWSVRIFKTRTDASEACKKGRVLVNNVQVKPSRDLKIGDVVTVKRPPIDYVYTVVGLIENRQPAKNVPLYAENITPQEELDMLKIQKNTLFVQRDRGAGRPTKKERRDIDKFQEFSTDSEDF